MTLDRCIVGDCREVMRDLVADGVKMQTCVTSPPYFGLRDYGMPNQIGLETTPAAYVDQIVSVFRLVRDLLSDDGTAWLNLGDCYAGSGRGGDTGKSGLQGSSANQDESKRGRAAQRGSQLAAGLHENQRQHGQIGRAWVPAPHGFKQKDLMGIPWRVAFALQEDGWWLRNDIVWSKPNPMPESVTDRCTKSHEYVFLLAKSEKYFCNMEAIKEPAAFDTDGRYGRAHGGYKPPGQRPHNGILAPRIKRSGNIERKPRPGPAYDPRHQCGSVPWEGSSRNKRSVWTVPVRGFPEAHFAVMPEALIEPCILAGSRPGDIVFDPFMGAGTVGAVASRLGRRWLGVEINPTYVEMQKPRTAQQGMPL